MEAVMAAAQSPLDPTSKLNEFKQNRYFSQAQAPFIVHIESQDTDKIIGHIDPIKLGEILIKSRINFDNVRKIGPKKVELTFTSMDEAYEVVENPNPTTQDWEFYIPN